MLTFREFSHTDEVVTMQTRMKMKAAAKKNKAKIALGKKKASKKLASKEQLKKRAENKARGMLIKKILKGKSKSDLSFSARGDLEKKLKKKKGAIKKIAKKLLPAVKQADRAKLKRNKEK
jgi:hypothetical protein